MDKLSAQKQNAYVYIDHFEGETHEFSIAALVYLRAVPLIDSNMLSKQDTERHGTEKHLAANLHILHVFIRPHAVAMQIYISYMHEYRTIHANPWFADKKQTNKHAILHRGMILHPNYQVGKNHLQTQL